MNLQSICQSFVLDSFIKVFPHQTFALYGMTMLLGMHGKVTVLAADSHIA